MQLDIMILLEFPPLNLWTTVCFIPENKQVTNTSPLFLTKSNKYAIVVCFLTTGCQCIHSGLVFAIHIGH